jgi:hypothetical protein
VVPPLPTFSSVAVVVPVDVRPSAAFLAFLRDDDDDAVVVVVGRRSPLTFPAVIRASYPNCASASTFAIGGTASVALVVVTVVRGDIIDHLAVVIILVAITIITTIIVIATCGGGSSAIIICGSSPPPSQIRITISRISRYHWLPEEVEPQPYIVFDALHRTVVVELQYRQDGAVPRRSGDAMTGYHAHQVLQ